MSHRDRQASAGTTATVAAPPPKHSPNAAAGLRSPSPAEATPAVTSPWDLLYRGLPPGQQADLLALAGRQGLLYTHQLPCLSAASRALPSGEEPRTWNLLGKMLAGQLGQLDPVRPAAVQVLDADLDEAQRHAVAAALATPDVCLIQGWPGTGKSRVLAEIVTQAAMRGDRVLLMAAHPAGVDRVLEQVGKREALCPIRCLAPEETAAQLPAAIRALTLTEKTATLRQQAVTSARETREAAEMQCARRRHEEGLWPQLRDLAQALDADRAAIARAEEHCAAVPGQVEKEVETADGTSHVAREIKALKHAHEQRLTQLAADSAAAEQEREKHQAKVAEVGQAIAAVEPLAQAKQHGRWWSLKWWKATFKGDVAGQLAQLQAQHKQEQEALSGAEKRLHELTDAQRHSTTQTELDCRSRIQAEVNKRQNKHRAAVADLQDQTRRHETLWADLVLQIDTEALRPTGQTLDAVQAAQEKWHRQRQDDEARSTLAREWNEFLDHSGDSLAARLPGYANLVAATPAALVADPHFGDAAASGGQFDLLVLDEADQLAESDFLKCARRARQWVLVGEPALPSERHGDRGKHATSRAAAGSSRGQYFHKLWDHLHCDPSQLPYAWFLEQDRLGCRMRQLAPEQRQWLETEPLADAPDVELRILALPHVRPVLAEVVFPVTMPLPAAKEFLFRELQEIPVQTAGRSIRWRETPERIALCFAAAGTEAPAVCLDAGVREVLSGTDGDTLGHTSRLEFDCTAGWDRAAVQRWLTEHLRLCDLGRTAWLETPHRAAPALAAVLSDLVLGDGHGVTGNPDGAEGAVEFLAVMGKGKGPGRDSRGPRRSDPAPTGLPATGSGLEIDLSVPRQAERLPHDLRAHLPNRGFANLPEARAVVRKLEELARKPGHVNGQGHGPEVAVVALYPAQAELIRLLMQQSPVLAGQAGSISVVAPGGFRQREADLVIVSLTRSHSHRAVAYGEGPAALALAWTRARKRLVLVGDAGNLVRRSQWHGVLDHLDEAAAGREARLLGQLVRYVQGQGLHQAFFRVSEGSMA